MGVFFERTALDRDEVKGAIKESLEKDPNSVSDPEKEAEEKTAEIAPEGYGRFNVGRFIGALVIFGVIVGAAIATDAAGGMDDSSKALWGFAATIFGVVVGFLAGEKTAG